LSCGGILSGSIITKCSPDSESEISLKIGQYFKKVKRRKSRTKQRVSAFLDHPVLSDEDHYSLQSGICALQEWSDKWLLKLNACKCKSVYYGRNINHNYT